LVYQPETAWNLVDILLGNPQGSTSCTDISGLGELERSTLGEMGNIMGTFFLNAVGDRTKYELRPTPPLVVMDMMGAILDASLAEIMMESDEIVLVDATFGTKDSQINGTFVVMPSPGLLTGLMRSWGKA
jgi:chemotaxis protein CheC